MTKAEDGGPASKGRELQRVGRYIFGRNNLIGTDFEDVSAWQIDRKFVQTSAGGILIQLAISHHALGKIATEELDEALAALLDDGRGGDKDSEAERMAQARELARYQEEASGPDDVV